MQALKDGNLASIATYPLVIAIFISRGFALSTGLHLGLIRVTVSRRRSPLFSKPFNAGVPDNTAFLQCLQGRKQNACKLDVASVPRATHPRQSHSGGPCCSLRKDGDRLPRARAQQSNHSITKRLVKVPLHESFATGVASHEMMPACGVFHVASVVLGPSQFAKRADISFSCCSRVRMCGGEVPCPS